MLYSADSAIYILPCMQPWITLFLLVLLTSYSIDSLWLGQRTHGRATNALYKIRRSSEVWTTTCLFEHVVNKWCHSVERGRSLVTACRPVPASDDIASARTQMVSCRIEVSRRSRSNALIPRSQFCIAARRQRPSRQWCTSPFSTAAMACQHCARLSSAIANSTA